MEVILKRTKITKAIFGQIIRGKNSLFVQPGDFKILGWVLVNKGNTFYRSIILYNEAESKLLKLPFSSVSKIKKEGKNRQESDGNGGYIFPKVYFLKLYLPDYNQEITIFESKVEAELKEMETRLKLCLTEVCLKGQIYI
jgi:hypothetical protein